MSATDPAPATNPVMNHVRRLIMTALSCHDRHPIDETSEPLGMFPLPEQRS
jgi:hypothetical protein